MGIRTWSGSAWGAPTTLNATNSEGAVNSAAVPDPIAPNALRSLPIGTFGEAAINLTGAQIIPAGTCESFGSTFLKSRSSSSFTAEIKDFIAPVPVNISNCGTVIIRKATVPAGGAGFGFTSTVVSNPTDSTAVSFSLNDGGIKEIDKVIAGSYNVTEPSVAGYHLTSINCSAGTLAPTNTSITTGRTDFTMSAGKVLDCTYTNTRNKTNPTESTTPTLIPQDSVTIGNFSSGDNSGHLNVSLYADNCTGTALYTEDLGAISGNGTFSTTNSGKANVNAGYSIPADGTYYWQAVYEGDSANNGFTTTCTAESYALDVTP